MRGMRYRAPRESFSSPTAPITTTSPGPWCRLPANSAAASAPFASHAPLPCTRPPSTRTGISPSTVSMCPRKRTCGVPGPLRAGGFPAPSSSVVYPSDFAIVANACAAFSSAPEGLYAFRNSTKAPTSSMGKDTLHRIEGGPPLVLTDHERRQQADHIGPPADGDHALLLERLQVLRGLIL